MLGVQGTGKGQAVHVACRTKYLRTCCRSCCRQLAGNVTAVQGATDIVGWWREAWWGQCTAQKVCRWQLAEEVRVLLALVKNPRATYYRIGGLPSLVVLARSHPSPTLAIGMYNSLIRVLFHNKVWFTNNDSSRRNRAICP